jgi:hypothetical protein
MTYHTVSFSPVPRVVYAKPQPLEPFAVGCLPALQQNVVDTLYHTCAHPKPWRGEDRREDPLVQNYRRVRGAKGQTHVDTLFYQTCYEVLVKPDDAKETMLGRLPELSIANGDHPTAWHTRHTEREFVEVLMDRVTQALDNAPKIC